MIVMMNVMIVMMIVMIVVMGKLGRRRMKEREMWSFSSDSLLVSCTMINTKLID